MAQAQPKPGQFVFHIERTFDAPRERVWEAWEDSEQFKQWMGPKGSGMTYCDMDFRAGGAVRFTLEFEGTVIHGQWTFREIIAPEKIVAIVSFTDEKHEKIIEHPGKPGWPLKILSIVTFTAIGDKTKIEVAWSAYEASDAEAKFFEENADSMHQGWSGTFDRLEELLENNQQP